jgi:predicted RNA-binding protein with PUA-like domain
MFYLLKTEPEAYSFENLQRDGETIWDGVTNPAAVHNLKNMKPGDKLIIYHTGDERRVVGTASVVSVEIQGKTPLVRIKVGHEIKQPKSLADIKQKSLFGDSALVRQGRLSVVPLSAEQHQWLVG